MKPQRVDGVSLVVGLPGTGSDPPPSSDRDALLGEMQTREVDKPQRVLASPSTALVRVRGFIPPGARKGDHFDLFVESPRDSGTKSIESGWLMPVRMHEYAVLQNRVAEGHLLARGQGDVLTDALLDSGDDVVRLTRGRVLGGGVVMKSRGFGLVVRDEFTSVKTSTRIGDAINRRFSVYHNGTRQGVANPKRDDYIELLVHPAYVDNIPRYLRVIQNIAVREAPKARSMRLGELRLNLADPSTAAQAALQLEAFGEDGIPALRDALDSSDPEIRFYASEALAYQDVPDAVDDLARSIRREPAFRSRALAALAAMDDLVAQEALVDLLHTNSAESRYGAFRILRRRAPDDPVIAGQVVNDSFTLHRVSSTGPELIHVSRLDRPEIVCFGGHQEFTAPVVVFAGSEIVIRNNHAGGITVSRLSAGEEDEAVDCSLRVVEVVEAIGKLGGKYADVVCALTEARRNGCLPSRLEFSAIPMTSRTYQRGETNDEDSAADDQPADESLPLPPSSPSSFEIDDYHPAEEPNGNPPSEREFTGRSLDEILPTNDDIPMEEITAGDLHDDLHVPAPAENALEESFVTRQPIEDNGELAQTPGSAHSVPVSRQPSLPYRRQPVRIRSTSGTPGTQLQYVPNPALALDTGTTAVIEQQIAQSGQMPSHTASAPPRRNVPPQAMARYSAPGQSASVTPNYSAAMRQGQHPVNVPAAASPDGYANDVPAHLTGPVSIPLSGAPPANVVRPTVAPMSASNTALSAPLEEVSPGPTNLTAQVRGELQKPPKAQPPSVPPRLNASPIPQGEVAPSPPDLGPVREFSDLIDTRSALLEGLN